MEATTMTEKKIWEGGPSQWAHFWFYLLCAVTSVLVIPAIIGIKRWLEIRCTSIELTTERIITTKGILAKTTDSLELYRVRDIQIDQSVWYRMVGIGTIKLETSDKTDPIFIFDGIKNSRELLDMIRANVEICRKNKNVREIDIEQ